MQNIKKKIEEVDLFQFIKILRPGLWIILFFSLLGIFIGYLYENSNKPGEVRFTFSIPIYELTGINLLRLKEYNLSLKKIHEHEYEKSLFQYFGFKTGDFLSDFDVILENRIQGIISKLKKTDSGEFENDYEINSENLLSLIAQITQREHFISKIVQKYNNLIYEKYSANEDRLNFLKIKTAPTYMGTLRNNESGAQSRNYNFKFFFAREFDEEMVENFSKVIITLINNDINQQLLQRFELVKSNYFTEISYIKKNLKELTTSVRNDYKVYLELLIQELTFQRDIAMSFGLAQPSNQNLIISVDKFSMKWFARPDYKNGYNYLNMEIDKFSSRLNEDYAYYIPELRFFDNAIIEIDKHVTLEKADKQIKNLGMLNNTFVSFESPLINRQNIISYLKIQNIDNDNAYSTVFLGLIGLLVGIFITIVNFYFYKKK